MSDFSGVDRYNFHYTQQITKYYSKSFYLSARLLPKKTQEATFALYGFCRYADNLIDNPRQRNITELLAEIGYLENEIRIAYRTGESEHPIISAFITTALEYGIPLDQPLELLKGVVMDLQFKVYDDFDKLYMYCYRVAGVVGKMMTYILGYSDETAFTYAEKLGVAMQLTNILRDIEEDIKVDRLYLPLTDLKRFNVTERQIRELKFNYRMQDLIEFQVRRADNYFAQGNAGIGLLQRKSRFAISAASQIYRGILRQIEANGFNPFLGRVFVPRSKKLFILMTEIVRNRIFPIKVEKDAADDGIIYSRID
ncbi:MAG: phytoene/squalene synthase family protein [Calditrichaeota bacterium]|nr:phytoene/squalene synthase family protein [Calditrichota bacterium]